VTEEFIQQVMQKNNTSRQSAINILKDYGYVKFPEKQSVTSTVKGRIKGE
jgi:Mn-dependent DtxR family transcriptional regulator